MPNIAVKAAPFHVRPAMQRIAIVLFALMMAVTKAIAQDTDVEAIIQHARTNRLGFSVTFARSGPEQINAMKLMVFDQTSGHLVQQLDLESASVWSEPADFVAVVDANFDGHADITVPFAEGGSGPNYTLTFYLFDPKSQMFVKHDGLSDLPQPTVHKNGTITSSSRGSCCQHSSETYRFIRGTLTLVADWDESYTTDGKWIVTTTRNLVAGKWRTRVKKTKQPTVPL